MEVHIQVEQIDSKVHRARSEDVLAPGYEHTSKKQEQEANVEVHGEQPTLTGRGQDEAGQSLSLPAIEMTWHSWLGSSLDGTRPRRQGGSGLGRPSMWDSLVIAYGGFGIFAAQEAHCDPSR
jgi:hypothetical protein